MLYTNYNAISLALAEDGKYKEGDIFKVTSSRSKFDKIWDFDGLKIKSIHYNFGVVLTFDWNEWQENKVKRFKS